MGMSGQLWVDSGNEKHSDLEQPVSNEQDWTDSGQTRMGHWIHLDGQWTILDTSMMEKLDGHDWTMLGGQWKPKTSRP